MAQNTNEEYFEDWVDYHSEDALFNYTELKEEFADDDRLQFIRNSPDFEGFDDLDDEHDAAHREYQEASERIDALIDMSPEELADEFGEDSEGDEIWQRLDDEMSELEEQMGNASDQFSEAFEEFFEDLL